MVQASSTQASSEGLFLGVDGGGTKTEFVLIDREGRLVARHQTGTSYYLQIGFDGLNRVLMEGKLTYALGARSIDCTIRDLSDTGARVRLAGAEPMPEQVVLIQMRSGVAFDATVAWSRDRDLGLTFTGSHRLDEDCPPAMAPLRRLWLEHLPR